MLKSRVIPVVIIREGLCVQSRRFRRYQALGNPYTIVQRLSSWSSDELIFLDITRTGAYDLGRDDTNFSNLDTIERIVEEMSGACFMPLTVGGGIRTIDDVAVRLAAGADKITVNTLLATAPAIVTEAANEFGSQCVVASIDVQRDGSNLEVRVDGGREPVDLDPLSWARRAADLGAGELLVNSIDRDGQGDGYDLDLLHAIVDAVPVPVIALGGVGSWEHMQEGFETGAAAVAAANIFHHTEGSVTKAKRHIFENGGNVRAPEYLDEGL